MRRNLLFMIFSLLVLAGCDTTRGAWQSRPHQYPPEQNPPAVANAPLVPEQGGQQAMQVKSKVALLLPLSGRGKETGEAMLNASMLAMNDLGASDLFELMPEDTGPGASVAVQKSLANGAGLILGPVFSDDTKAVAPLAVQRGVPVVSFSTDTTAAVGSTFLMGFVPQTQVEQILDYAAARGLTRIALIAPRDAYGDAVAATFYSHVRFRGYSNAGLLRYEGVSAPSPEQFAALRQAAPTAVLIAAAGPQAAKISAALSAQGMSPQMVKRLGTGLWDDLSAQRQPELQGAWYAASTPDLRVRFERRYRETYGATPPRLASLAYDATALAVVLSKTGKGFGRSTLTNPNGFAGIDGIFRFRMDGLAERGLGILEIGGQSARVIQPAATSFAFAKK